MEREESQQPILRRFAPSIWAIATLIALAFVACPNGGGTGY
jgi:hypothetical protein